jgi:endonuclease YncB( thermonuclease family)
LIAIGKKNLPSLENTNASLIPIGIEGTALAIDFFVIFVVAVDRGVGCEAMKRGFSIVWLVLIFFLVLPCPLWAWSGKVIGVADGDTITVLRDKQPQKIRLYGIDCPEKRQPFGKRAKQFTSDMVFGKLVEVEPVATDRYGRTVAFVQVESVLVNEELIKEGLGWVYIRYCKLPLCVEWKGLELEAKFGKRGLWGESGEIPPWDFRRQKRKHRTPVVSLNANL